MTKRKSKAAPKKPQSRFTKVFAGCFTIVVALIIIGALLPGKKPDTSVALAEATFTSRPDVRDTPTDPPGVTIIPTVVRASSGFVTITPGAGTIYPSATITDTPQPTITNTDSPTSSPAPQITSVAGDLYDVISTANARSCPASTCDLIGKLQSGSVISVTGIASGENYKNSPLWMQTVYHDGQTVYIHSSLVTLHRDYVQPTQQPVVVQQQPAPAAVMFPDNCKTAVAMGLSPQQAAQDGLDANHNGVACYGS